MTKDKIYVDLKLSLEINDFDLINKLIQESI
jgi:hypothetical protein